MFLCIEFAVDPQCNFYYFHSMPNLQMAKSNMDPVHWTISALVKVNAVNMSS